MRVEGRMGFMKSWGTKAQSHWCSLGRYRNPASSFSSIAQASGHQTPKDCKVECGV